MTSNIESDNQEQKKINSNVEDEFKFTPMLYHFRIAPQRTCDKTFALQQPFATLFDNLITVLWSVYSKKSTIQIGVNQLQWALEFLKCMKVDYDYPKSINNVVTELEEQLIRLYAKIGDIMLEEEQRKEEERMERDLTSKTSQTSRSGNSYENEDTNASYNEEDIMKKLDAIKLVLDPITGEAKYLKELNSLGNRKHTKQASCPVDKKSSKNYMINALQKILVKTTDSETKSGVEELIKELKVETPPVKKTT